MIVLKLTSRACPEQYDAYLGDRQVGYLRLRHGYFRVEYPDVGGEEIYSADPKGDGSFWEDERDYYLRFAVDAIQRRLAAEEEREGDGRPPAPDVQYRIDRGDYR